MNNLNYGVIGNCRTAALISEKGNIEWLCFPDFDSPSIFAALLDRDKGGCFGFEVSNEYHISQSYVPHTNILSTHFSSDEGEFVVLDFMPCYRSYEKEHYLPAEIYRYIRWIKGTPRFKVNYNPAPDYARGKVIHNITDEYIETYCSSENKDRQYLYSSLSLQDIEQKKEITLQRDEFFLLSYNEKVIPIDIEREKLEYCRTLVYWLNWTNRTKKYSLYNDVIERSLLVLKLMSYYNGAVLAARNRRRRPQLGLSFLLVERCIHVHRDPLPNRACRSGSQIYEIHSIHLRRQARVFSNHVWHSRRKAIKRNHSGPPRRI